MGTMNFQELELSGWEATRDTLQAYSKILGAIRRGQTPRQRHWSHITLRVDGSGLTTTPIPIVGRAFEIRLDLLDQQVHLRTSDGERWQQPLNGESPRHFAEALSEAMETFGIPSVVEPGDYTEADGEWDRRAVGRFWKALVQIDGLFKAFKGEQRQETSPVQLFPHHFDLALSWFSGRLIPGEDPEDEGRADEQMTFGFTTGDQTLPEAYFYATAYPEPDRFQGSPLPEGARWHQRGFSGAVLPYARLVAGSTPGDLLGRFLRQALEAGRMIS